MNELKKTIVSVIIRGVICGLLITAASHLFAGCATTRGVAGDLGQSNSYIAGKLEASVEGFDRGIGEAVERSRRIEDDIERLVYLFDEYEQAALGLRDEVERLRREVEMAQEAGGYGGGIGVPVRGGEGGDADSAFQGNTSSRDN